MEAIIDDIAIRPAWGLNDEQIVRDVKRLWSLHNLGSAVIEKRQSEICAAAYSGGDLAAVSTAYISYVPSMRNKFFAYRCMVTPQFRQRDLAWRITAYSLKLLQEWSTQNAQERILGLMIDVETDKFTAGLRQPVREKFGVTMRFVGYNQKGQQMRVVWFDDAMLDDAAAP